MKIQIKEENNKQLLQCLYLGNLVINEYRQGEGLKEYSSFLDDILLQVVKSTEARQFEHKFSAIPYEKNQDNKLADLYDSLEDSTQEYYNEFCKNMLNEILKSTF